MRTALVLSKSLLLVVRLLADLQACRRFLTDLVCTRLHAIHDPLLGQNSLECRVNTAASPSSAKMQA